MACECDNGCETCPPKGYICLPRGDAVLVKIAVHENSCDGDLFDISAASEIVFLVADSLGGTVRITKKLSTNGIAVSTNGFELYFTITSADCDSLVNQTNYFECRITTAAGHPKTVLSGVFKSPDTMIKELT